MTIEELLEQCIQKNLIDLTISGLKKKNEELPVKIKVRPVAMKDNIEYQVSEFIGRKVFHKNYKRRIEKEDYRLDAGGLQAGTVYHDRCNGTDFVREAQSDREIQKM